MYRGGVFGIGTLAAIAMIACSGGGGTGGASPVVDAGSSASSTPDGGSNGAIDDAGVAAGDAIAKCHALVTSYCARAVGCNLSDAGTPASQQQDCETAAGGALNCAQAISVGATYDACVADMPTIQCTKFTDGSGDPLPASCEGVIQASSVPDAGAATAPAATKPNAIYGRASASGQFDTYLGCVCNSSDPDSIASSVGVYGSNSKFSASSMWNRFGTYGSDFSSQSACNKFASDPPIVVNNGQIVGRITRNQFIAGAVTDPDVVALLNQSVCVN